jgi:hypothetical protein
MITKNEAIQRIYGDNPPFIWDGSLPQTILDNIAAESCADFPDDEIKKEYRRKVYDVIRCGCVFAYDRKGNGSGLLPLTSAARLELQISNYANLIYVPTIDETEPTE